MGVWIMAGVTFREAARKKMLWMALAAGGAFLILFGTGLHFQAKDFAAHGISPVSRREISFTMVTMGLYAVDLLAVLMTILTSIDTLSGEIASGTIQAIATKPVPRWQLLLGKWLGFCGMLTGYIALMVGGVNTVTYVMAGVTARHLARGLSLIWMESIVLLSVNFCVCNLLFHADHGRTYPRAARTRISPWLDRAIWGYHPDAACGQCWGHCKYSDAQRSPLAPRRLRNAVSPGKCLAHLPIQHTLGSEYSNDLLCRVLPDSRPWYRDSPLLPP